MFESLWGDIRFYHILLVVLATPSLKLFIAYKMLSNSLFHPHGNSVIDIILILKMRKLGSQSLSDLPKGLQLLSAAAETGSRVLLTQCSVLAPPPALPPSCHSR